MEILLHCVASVSVRFMGNEQGRRVKDYAKTGVSAVRFRCKERGKRVKDRAKNGASMKDRGTGFSFLACWNPESGKILLVESGILNFGIQNIAQGIRNPTRRNQLTLRYCKKEREMSNPGIPNPLRGVQNPTRM